MPERGGWHRGGERHRSSARSGLGRAIRGAVLIDWPPLCADSHHFRRKVASSVSEGTAPETPLRSKSSALRKAVVQRHYRPLADIEHDAVDGCSTAVPAKGIDPELLRRRAGEGHFGLRGMRERAKIADGKVTVWSAVESGTEVELRIPASHAYASPSVQPRLARKTFGQDETSDS